MKHFIVLSVFALTCYFGFLVDKSIVDWLLRKCPDSEWLEIIEVFLWIGMIFISFSIIITAAYVATFLTAYAIKDLGKRPDNLKPSNVLTKSKWMQKVEKAIKERELKRSKI
jgi:uncharacterized membrane protein